MEVDIQGKQVWGLRLFGMNNPDCLYFLSNFFNSLNIVHKI